jgi:cytochrome oxidase Cu insertion factor (SCO1/SenC/PrrC family)
MKKLLPLAVFAVMGCRDHRMIQPTLALPTPGTAVPAFAFDLRGGKQLQSSALTGRPTVLFLWSTHCPTSRRALAAYRDIQRLYTVRGVRVIMLSDDESRDELALLPKILADSGVVGDVALARGKLGAVFDRSATAPQRDTARVEFVLPAYLVVDRDGRIAARSWGPDTPVVRAAIDSLLASRPAA